MFCPMVYYLTVELRNIKVVNFDYWIEKCIDLQMHSRINQILRNIKDNKVPTYVVP